MKKTKLKSPAIIAKVPKDLDECAKFIHEIGMVTREIVKHRATMNDALAEVTHAHSLFFTPLQQQLDLLQTGVQCWCEANRDELTKNGKSKSGYFLTGNVQWRQKPPSVSVKNIAGVLDLLKQMGLTRFVRVEESLNKEAILAEKALVKGIPGLTIKEGFENFIIEPFEQDAPRDN